MDFMIHYSFSEKIFYFFIEEIIEECLSGKESAEEAARLIQSKLSLYMSEHYA